jgi:excisionase family DNA binding protein
VNKSEVAPIEPLLTREEAAELLGMSPSWVRGQIRRGNLRSVKLGKLVRIEPQDLREFINRYRSTVGEFVGTPYLPGLLGPNTEITKVIGKKRL